MTGSSPSPLDIARHTADMGKKNPGDRWLNAMTLGLLLSSGLVAVGGMVLKFWREIRGKERDNAARSDRHTPASASPPHADADTYEETSRDGKKWSHRPELAARQPQDDHAQAAHRPQHSHARQH
jgi:hypothetical protein